ncbi:DIS3-like exonuclease 2 isoform X2 [Anoplophora glabripennis]|nr:DIS3-like exonuclease 2 isoform X2 [Anoplophora glabripennis]XP_018564156.1 DIS3-like exonuclease 2 isoform X2 [Anoplophora glabripennis]
MMERRNSMPPLELSSYFEARTSKNVLYTSVSNSNIVKLGKEEKAKRTRRSRKNKTPKQAPDNVTNMTPVIKKFHNVSQSNFETTPQKQKPLTNKCTVQTPVAPKQKHIVKQPAEQVEIKASFTVKPVESPETGYFLRRRNSRYKYINLKSFTRNINKTPCVFVSNLTTPTDLAAKCEKLSIYGKKDMTKAQLKRFPQGLRQNEPTPSTSAKPVKRKKKEKKPITFEEYIDAVAVTERLKKGELVKGIVRINPKNFKDAYVSNEDTSLSDYYLTSVVDRNRALEGDEVILKIKPKDQWMDGKKTAAVVYISKLVHPRISIGVLKPLEKKNSEFAMFYPRDKRIPLLRIPAISWPNGFQANPKQYEKILFVAKIVEWKVPTHAIGMLTENLGAMGDLGVETMSILREFDLDITPFSPYVLECLPKSDEIPQKEFEYREDIRKQCAFTIDPATARDLDDAVSVRELPNGNYEVGVHISDASFYLEEGTELDQMVSKKATTVYMVQKAYHMLPIELCLIYSLLPGQDRLSFSVFWEMTQNGDIISKRFTRSIMNSCTQLAYEHAQMIIENPNKEFKEENFPTIHNGFTVDDLRKTINVLQNIAVKLRERRMRNGTLKIDQVKLSFNLDPKTGEPLDFWIYENKESHRLIEEFMLLANITVAQRINEYFPDIAFLRCHEPPKQTMLVELQNNLATCGIHIDISSSGGINASMKKYITDDYPGQCRAAVLNHITAKAMTRARYFCAATMESELDYKHYALSIPIYTHFTSPIRRYADIMAHRLLAASLNYCEKPAWDADYVKAIAANCNAQKYNAKRAGEASCDLYLAHYVEKHQPFEQDCVVVDVKERSFDVIVLKTGSIVRIYQNSCEEGTTWQTEVISSMTSEVNARNGEKSKGESEKRLYRLRITFPKTKHFPEYVLIVELFTSVKVNLMRQNSYKLEGTLLRPIMSQSFARQ